MSGKSLDYSALFARGLPLPAAQWQSHPKYNFIGGQSDPELEPMEQFIESATNVFKGDPRTSPCITLTATPRVSFLCAASWSRNWPPIVVFTSPLTKC